MTDTTTLRNHRPLTTALLFRSTTTRSTTKPLLYIFIRAAALRDDYGKKTRRGGSWVDGSGRRNVLFSKDCSILN